MGRFLLARNEMREICDVYVGYRNDKTGEKSQPHEWQRRFHSSGAKFKLLVGAWSSGKTVSGYIEGIQHSTESPNNLGLVCRETYDELRDTTRKEWLERTPRGLIKSFSQTKNELVLWSKVRGTTSTILFRSLIDAQHHRQSRKFGSYKLGWFHIDEGDILHEDEFNILAARLNRVGVIRRQGWITMNPTNPDHWMLKRFTSGDPDYEIIYSNTYQNQQFLPDGYIEDLEKLYSPEWIRRYLEGKFVFLAEGEPVYPLYNDALHDIKTADYIQNRIVHRGWDFGFRHPAVVFSQQDTRDRLIIQHEYMGTNMTTIDFCRLVEFLSGQLEKGELSPHLQKLIYSTELKPFYPAEARFQDYCDPAGAQVESDSGSTRVAVLNSEDIFPEYRASKIDERLRIIRFLLNPRSDGEPGVKIAGTQCPILCQGFLGGYKLTTRGDVILEDVPFKDGWFEHLFDALGYKILFLYPEAFERPRHREEKYIVSEAVSGLA